MPAWKSVVGGLAAAGSSALNQYLERDSDRTMKRTRKRPLVTGAIARPGWIPYLATLMILLPSLAVLPFNPALTFFLLLGAVIYVGLYTLWLKPRTLLNIVLGGAAGSAAVLSGSAAAGAWNDPGAVTLALLVFLWTPCHFWSLAIVYQELLTGHRPYTGKNVRQLAQQHLQAQPDLRALPEGERPVVARALAKDPEKRFPNCMEFMRALYAARTPIRVSSPAQEPALVGEGKRSKTLVDTLEDIWLDAPPNDVPEGEGAPPHPPAGENLRDFSPKSKRPL